MDDARIVFRPTLRSMKGRFLSPLLVAVLAACVVTEGGEGIPTLSELADQPFLGRVLTAMYAIVFGAIAIIPPLTGLWSRVSITRDRFGNLKVFTWLLFPRTRNYRLDSFTEIHFGVADTHVNKVGKYSGTRHEWWWFVQPVTESRPALKPAPGSPAFVPLKEKIRTLGRPPSVPEPVVVLRDWLSRATGLPAVGPLVFMLSEKPPRKREMVWPILGTYDRAANPQPAQQSAGGDATVYRFRDDQGNLHTYSSLEEMPPDVRAVYEQDWGD